LKFDEAFFIRQATISSASTYAERPPLVVLPGPVMGRVSRR
jgi:hypothetical protein